MGRAKYQHFRFISYEFDHVTARATFHYGFDEQWTFTEEVNFETVSKMYCTQALEQAMFYCFIVLGSSYYKLFPEAEFKIEQGEMNQHQAQFFTDLYRGGLSQFVYENKLDPAVIQEFKATTDQPSQSWALGGEGIILQQSGGKDSLLAAKLLQEAGHDFDAWHMSSTGHHPAVIDNIGARGVLSARRAIDLQQIRKAQEAGGLNGHVPFSAMTAGLAMVQAVLNKSRYVVAAMEASSDEPNTYIGDYPVNHMHSKTFAFEQQLQDYIHSHIASDLDYMSLIRPFSDLRVAELFSELAWGDYASDFASCNVANYKQGEEDGKLTWCGDCSKCANSYLLFAPFVDYEALVAVFDGQNLFEKQSLRSDFEALLGLAGVKPFECVGTVDELRAAYALAGQNDVRLQIEDLKVPPAEADFRALSDHQEIIREFLPSRLFPHD